MGCGLSGAVAQAFGLHFLGEHISAFDAEDRTIRFGLLTGPGEAIVIWLAWQLAHVFGLCGPAYAVGVEAVRALEAALGGGLLPWPAGAAADPDVAAAYVIELVRLQQRVRVAAAVAAAAAAAAAVAVANVNADAVALIDLPRHQAVLATLAFFGLKALWQAATMRHRSTAGLLLLCFAIRAVPLAGGAPPPRCCCSTFSPVPHASRTSCRHSGHGHWIHRRLPHPPSLTPTVAPFFFPFFC